MAALHHHRMRARESSHFARAHKHTYLHTCDTGSITHYLYLAHTCMHIRATFNHLPYFLWRYTHTHSFLSNSSSTYTYIHTFIYTWNHHHITSVRTHIHTFLHICALILIFVSHHGNNNFFHLIYIISTYIHTGMYGRIYLLLFMTIQEFVNLVHKYMHTYMEHFLIVTI